MKFRISGDLNDYTDLELALLVMLGQFGNGADRRNALGKYYDNVQELVEDLAVGVVPVVHHKGAMSDDEIRAALEKIKPTDADFNAMVSEFINALK